MSVTDAELRALLMDCLAVWGLAGRVDVDDSGIVIRTADACFGLRQAAPDEHPVRWWLTTPVRDAAGRGPRATLSTAAVLTALKGAIGECMDRPRFA